LHTHSCEFDATTSPESASTARILSRRTTPTASTMDFFRTGVAMALRLLLIPLASDV